MAENMGKWSSGHPQPAKIRLPGRLWNKTIQLRRNLDIIIVDLEAIWEVSAKGRLIAQVQPSVAIDLL